MATAIIRPTGHIDHDSSTYLINNTQNMYDNNESTYAQGKNATSGYCVLTKFDASALSSALTNGGRITSITLCIKALGTNKNPKVWACHDASSTTSYTDCGDGSFEIDIDGTFLTEHTVSFPKAVNYWNENINAFLGGGFQIRITSVNYNVKVYEVYVRIEYEVPSITVTTSASPTDGGTVTGGGTYESGSTITAAATPNNGYAFSHWLIDGVNFGNSNPISGALTADTSVVAVFEKVQTSKIRYGASSAKSVFDTQKNKAKSVWYGKTKIF